jgi:hypothetical protein
MNLSKREIEVLREIISYIDRDVLDDNLERAGLGMSSEEELENLDDKLYQQLRGL